VVVYAYRAAAFQGEYRLPPASTRVGAGLVFGLLMAVAVAVTVLVGPSLVPTARRVGRLMRHGPHARLVIGILAAVVVVAGGVIVERSDVAIRSGPGRILNADTNNRTEWWRQAWEATTQSPVTGEGAGSFPLIHLRERRQDAQRLQTREPHQLTLEVTSELGLVGLLLALTGLGATVVAARRLGRAAVPPAAMLGVFLLQAQSDLTWMIPAAFLPAMAAAGVILGAHSARYPAVTRRTGVTLAVGVPLVAVATFSALTLWRADHDALQAVTRLQAAELADGRGAVVDWNPAIDAARSADRLNPLGIRGLLAEARALDGGGDRAGAVVVARRATDRQPDNPAAWECLAAVSRDGDRAAAIERMTPLDPRRDPNRRLSCRPGW